LHFPENGSIVLFDGRQRGRKTEMWAYLADINNWSFLRILLDFAIIAIFVYWILYFLRGTKSANVLFGVVVVFCLIVIVARVAKLDVLGYLLDRFWTILGTAVVVIFQPELRRVFAQAGSLFSRNVTNQAMIDEVVMAAVQMAESGTGALIVFERNIGLAGIVNTSVILDAKVNSLLLQTIFFKNSPLHDCAVIIRNDRIVAAHAVLPLMQEDLYNPVRRLGTRHRAAVGITEETDAVALAVSEETGTISIAHKGRIIRGVTSMELSAQLTHLLIQDAQPYRKLFSQAASSFSGTGSHPRPVQGDLFSETDDSEMKR